MILTIRVPCFAHFIPYAQPARALYMTTCPIATQFPGHGFIDDLTTGRSFELQATLTVDVIGIFFDMISMAVCATILNMQRSGRLVQESNVCTVDMCKKIYSTISKTVAGPFIVEFDSLYYYFI